MPVTRIGHANAAGLTNPNSLGRIVGHSEVIVGKLDYRYVWSVAEMQAKNEEWQMVCANVFGLEWSQRLRAMMDVRSLSSL